MKYGNYSSCNVIVKAARHLAPFETISITLLDLGQLKPKVLSGGEYSFTSRWEPAELSSIGKTRLASHLTTGTISREQRLYFDR